MANTLWHPASEQPRERTQPLLLATKTTWRDKDGKMLEFTGELIHSLNKNMKNHIPDELQEKLNLKKNKVLIGDAIEDKKMVPEEQWDETILVGFLNENIKNNLEKYKNSFDITLTKNDASFENLENCLNLSNIF